MWGLEIDQKQELNKHVNWWTSRNFEQNQLNAFKNLLIGSECMNKR